MSKYAVILHAAPGTHDGMGRAAHSLLYAKELKEAGIGVKLIFDGGGTAWLREFQKDDNPLRPLYEAVKATGVIAGVCKYCISARDNGEGMGAEDLAGVFTLGYRSKNRKSGSTGIGLPYSRLVVEAHGGRIWGESEIGKGATFHISLPAEGV